jgi:alkylation response protein AidB-like acyl-CoA dehydrogenase
MLPGEENRERAILMPPGLKEAFQEYYKNGFGRFGLPRKLGGLETPHGFIDMISEIVNAGSVAMGTSFELTGGASLILQNFGNDWMREVILPGLHDGRFQGTMCLTEAQAGSDLGAVTTIAERIEGTDRFAIKGAKVFITSGDHDMASNFMHIVLARIQGVAQKGTSAISLFLVPKFKLDDQGRSGEFNQVITQSLEHKHGMTTSPTVALKFDSSEGYLIARNIDEEMRQPSGMKMMFFFMNYMRHETGTAARAQAMATCLDALEYNNERIQGMPLRDGAAKRSAGPIFNHAGQRKALMDMFARTLAGRAMTLRLTEIRDHAEKDLEEVLSQVKKGRAQLPLSPETREIIAKLETEIAAFDRRFRKGEAAKKLLAKDPEGLARNELHQQEVSVSLQKLRAELNLLSPEWVELNERAATGKQKRKDEDNYALIFTSLVKAQVTDDNIRTLNDGMNAYGGLGFMDETPVSQRLRDSQVLCIWEGTNDIQALNTVGRQIGVANTDSKGKIVWDRLMEEIRAQIEAARLVPELTSAANVLEKCQKEVMAFREIIAQSSPKAKQEYSKNLPDADAKIKFGELVNASARHFNTWFAQLVEAAMFLRTALVAHKLIKQGGSEWETDFLQGRIWLAAHFILSPGGLDKSIFTWNDWFWNGIPWDLERKNLADASERILA